MARKFRAFARLEGKLPEQQAAEIRELIRRQRILHDARVFDFKLVSIHRQDDELILVRRGTPEWREAFGDQTPWWMHLTGNRTYMDDQAGWYFEDHHARMEGRARDVITDYVIGDMRPNESDRHGDKVFPALWVYQELQFDELLYQESPRC